MVNCKCCELCDPKDQSPVDSGSWFLHFLQKFWSDLQYSLELTLEVGGYFKHFSRRSSTRTDTSANAVVFLTQLNKF